MKTLIALLISTLTGCVTMQPSGDLGIDARAAIHATAISHARETLREAEEWRALAIEAESIMAPNK